MFLSYAAFSHSFTLVGKSMRLVPVSAFRVGILTPVVRPSPRLLHISAIAKSPTTEQAPSARSHLISFFAQYPEFKYDPSKSFISEFWKLVDAYGLNLNEKRFKAARRELRNAVLQEFKDIYGTHSCDIEVWQRFFNAIEIDEPPREIGQCHRKAKLTHLNICDLIDRPVTGIDIKTFPTVIELRDYTCEDIDRPRTVPPISKKEDPILGRLFRQVTNPRKRKRKSTSSDPNTPAEVTEDSKDAVPEAVVQS
ncbi:hypothetical protein B0J17DRAFT_672584 [Rhizoctonia solani]|nr:hypothetical protein B0J17DRAFT_672584 [Rhizoctonia solani]